MLKKNRETEKEMVAVKSKGDDQQATTTAFPSSALKYLRTSISDQELQSRRRRHGANKKVPFGMNRTSSLLTAHKCVAIILPFKHNETRRRKRGQSLSWGQDPKHTHRSHRHDDDVLYVFQSTPAK